MTPKIVGTHSSQRMTNYLGTSIIKIISVFLFFTLLSISQLSSAQSANIVNLTKNENDIDVVGPFALSSDNRVAYRAFIRSERKQGLYTASTSGGVIYEITDELSNLIAISSEGLPRFNSDGSNIVFFKGDNIYSAATVGGVPIQLNPPLSPSSEIVSFEISPDNDNVVYKIDAGIDGDNLYVTSINGGPSIKLNGPIDSDGNVTVFKISLDGSRVVYSTKLNGLGTFGALFSVPLAGGIPPTKLSPDVAVFFDESRATNSFFDISPDGNRVVYVAQLRPVPITTSTRRQIFTVPITGGESVKLNPPLFQVNDFKISADSEQVIFTAGLKPNLGSSISGIVDLFKASIIAPEPPTNLSDGIFYDANVDVEKFTLSSDSEYAVYYATSTARLLYSVSLKNNLAPVLLGRSISSSNFQISRDSKRVVFLSDVERSGTTELYGTPIAERSAQKLNGDIAVGPFDFRTGRVTSMIITPDSKNVVYQAFEDELEMSELYLTPIIGGDSLRLNLPTSSSSSSFENYEITPDSRRVVLLASNRTLYSICIEFESCKGGFFSDIIAPAIDLIFE